jgi:hypothetical protein
MLDKPYDIITANHGPCGHLATILETLKAELNRYSVFRISPISLILIEHLAKIEE